jgi:hypothetical protein
VNNCGECLERPQSDINANILDFMRRETLGNGAESVRIEQGVCPRNFFANQLPPGNLSRMSPDEEVKGAPEQPQSPGLPPRGPRRSRRGGRRHPKRREPRPPGPPTGETVAPIVPESSAPAIEEAECRRAPEPVHETPSVTRAIGQVNQIIDELKRALDEMEEVLETLELAERQKIDDEREIENLQRALRQLHRPRDGGERR